MTFNYIRYGTIFFVSLFLFFYISENYEDFIILDRLNTSSILILYLLYLLSLLVNCSQSYSIIGDPTIKIFPFIKIYILARFLTKIVPQSGNIYMGKMLKDKFKLNYSTFIERLFSLYLLDTLFIVLLSVVILFFTINNTLLITKIDHSFIILGISFLAIALLFIYIYNKNSKYKNEWINKTIQIYLNIINSLKNIYLVLKIFIYSFLSFLLMSFIFYQMFSSLSLDVNISYAIIFTSVLRVSQLVKITPGNIGVSEFLLAYVADFLGIGFNNGVMISLIYRVIAYTSIISFGLAFGVLALIKDKNTRA